jgi:uncharacterized RDD family membrane protein YckC
MNKITLTKRLSCMLLDHIIMSGIIIVCLIPVFIISFFIQRYFGLRLTWLIWSIALIIYFNKDFFRARSPAKKLFGFQVVDVRTGSIASRTQCFIRNITCILFPIEVLVTLFSKQRRIGDLIANTKVELSDTESLY